MNWLILVAAVGAGLTAGVFLAFSSFVMTGLGRAPAPVGVRVMQEINRAAPSPVFLLTLFGTALLVTGLAVVAVVGRGQGWGLVLAGAAAYLVCIVVTVAYHVPRNEALAVLDPAATDMVGLWRTYLSDWTRLNHLRAVSAAAGSMLLLLSRWPS
ncbi:MAG TPA: anthrone oxygenase family protein [Microlunatus sp.]